MDQDTESQVPRNRSMQALPSSSASVNSRLIAERIATLLSHYWTADTDPKLRQLQSADWLDDLEEFAAVTVAEACAEWRQKPGGRRPTPGDIRAICVEIRGRRCMRLLPAQASPHHFPSREDYYWLKSQEGQEHTDEDWRRIKAYQLAWERVQGREATDPAIQPMIDQAERLMREAMEL